MLKWLLWRNASRFRGGIFYCLGAFGLACIPFADANTDDVATLPFQKFKRDCAQLYEANQISTITGKDGWFFLRSELRHIGVGAFWGEAAAVVSMATRDDQKDPLPAIVDYNKRLAALGIELILLPVPTKASLYPDKLPGMDHLLTAASQRFDLDHVEFYRLLREQGVNVLDIYPAMANERAAGRGDMYCRTDTHWSGQACVKVAQLLAGVIQKKDWYGAQTKSHFQAEVRDIQIKGDLIRDEEAANSAPVETLSVRVIGTGSDVSNTPVEPDPGSPVLLLADSHGLVFHAGDDLLAKGAGLFDQLSYELGFATELVAARGSGATSTRISLYRKSAQDPDYMKSKKIVIWCFSAREFTEGTGWSAKVPVVK